MIIFLMKTQKISYFPYNECWVARGFFWIWICQRLAKYIDALLLFFEASELKFTTLKNVLLSPIKIIFFYFIAITKHNHVFCDFRVSFWRKLVKLTFLMFAIEISCFPIIGLLYVHKILIISLVFVLVLLSLVGFFKCVCYFSIPSYTAIHELLNSFK